MENENKFEYKEVKVPVAFTEDDRKKQLEKLKVKMAKDGWEFVSYFDGGLAKASTAKFKRELKSTQNQKSTQNISNGIKGFLLIALIAIVVISISNTEKSDENYLQDEANKTLAELKNEPKGTIRKVAMEFAKANGISENYYDTMYDCLAYYTYTKLDTFKVQKMLNWCKEDYDNNRTKEYINIESLLEDFSPWDGSYRPLEQYIKSNMKDSSSYEHIKTTYRFVFSGVKKPYMQVTTQFKGKNAFGATVQETVSCKVDAKTKELYDIKQSF